VAASHVYFADLRSSFKENLLGKIDRLLDSLELDTIVPARSLVALKLHFGEKGNVAFIRPNYIRQIADRVKEVGGSPFLTDTNTLYAGTRGDSVSHLHTAITNGFAYAVVNAPLIIADGMRGASSTSVSINQENIKRAHIGREIVESDVLISAAHFKGHELSGFGGTMKNVGMGCASRKGKLEQHSGLAPRVKAKKCIGCGQCIEHCRQGALSLDGEKAVLDAEKCVGCGECILICSNGAIDIKWNADMALFQKKMVEYTLAVLKGKKGRVAFLNFLTQISPACDCPNFNDAPLVRDLGILASTDPVAIDQASVDMVNQETGLENSCLTKNKGAGEDKFRGVYPEIDWSVQLAYAEEIGLGSREYQLVPL